MIQGARALIYERHADDPLWHICCNGGDMRLSGVPVLCGITIHSVGDNLYLSGETIEQKQGVVCPACINKARQQQLGDDK